MSDCSVSTSAVAHLLGRLVRAAAGEHREPREQPLLFRREEVVRPADRRVERLLARIGVAPALELDALPEPLEQLLGREDRNARGRELEREREVVEARAELGDRGRLRERRPQRARPRREQRRAVVGRPATAPIHACSPCSCEPLPARHEQLRPAGTRGGARCRSQPAAADARRCRAAAAPASRRASRRASPRRVKPGRSRTSSAFATASSASAGSRSAASETHQTPSGTSSATSAAACSASRVFPVPPGPGERQQPDVLAAQQADDLVQLALAAEERRRRDGKVRLVQRLQRREVAVAELEQALRRREVLEPVLAEVAHGRRRRRGRASPATASTCPPWPAAAIRAARWTSIPT